MKAVTLAALLTILFFAGLSAANRGGDITPPVLVAAAADRNQIDTSNAPQTITFTLHITDDLAGVRSVHVGFRHELGYNESRECQHWPDQRSKDAALPCAVMWPRYSAEGRWIVTWFAVTDSVGNSNAATMNVADCTIYDSGVCEHYEYNESATEVIRSMEIMIGPSVPGTDPPLYLPWLAR
jgi:hypothetical protein